MTISSGKNRRILLAERPAGAPTPDSFKFEDAPIHEPSDGQVLLKILYLSLDPYMRGRMSAAKSYARPVEIGDVMEGGTVARVVKSRHPDFAEGDVVLSHSGWQSFAISDGTGLRKLDPAAAPLSTALGVLGMPGFTAYAGLLTIGKPKAGETVVVAAASGAVGSAVGQIAKIKGARAVGIAGGTKKCAFVRDELGFDAVVDHHAPDFEAQLAAACPKGIDVYFENVGGKVWDAVLPLLNEFARVPVCGLIAQYNSAAHSGPDRLPTVMREILSKACSFAASSSANSSISERTSIVKHPSGSRPDDCVTRKTLWTGWTMPQKPSLDCSKAAISASWSCALRRKTSDGMLRRQRLQVA